MCYSIYAKIRVTRMYPSYAGTHLSRNAWKDRRRIVSPQFSKEKIHYVSVLNGFIDPYVAEL